MPVVGEFHTHYWENSSTAVTPVVLSTVKQYPAWQSSFVVGSIFGGLVPWFERAWNWLRWLGRSHPRIMRLDPEARLVLLTTLTALEHPAMPLARASVRKTAVTLGFNRPEAWRDLSHTLKRSPGDAENTFRHLESCRLVRANLLNSTVTNPECHLIVELAYQGFAARGR